MKIQIVSDLHLEFSDITLHNNNASDVLILSGDIMIADDLYRNPDTDNLLDKPGSSGLRAKLFRDFLHRCSLAFPHVVYVAGNHEFYDGKFPDAIDYLHQECSKYDNIHFLEMSHVVIQDVTFLGGTLWTDMNRGDALTLHSVQAMMNDFHVIRNSQAGYTKFRPAHAVERHRETVQYINKMVEGRIDEKFVVVGHHAPSTLSIHETHKHATVMNGAYVSDLSNIIMDRPQIKLWTHGHTHHSFDYMLGDTRIVCNPRGYEPYEINPGWDPDLTVEI